MYLVLVIIEVLYWRDNPIHCISNTTTLSELILNQKEFKVPNLHQLNTGFFTYWSILHLGVSYTVVS